MHKPRYICSFVICLSWPVYLTMNYEDQDTFYEFSWEKLVWETSDLKENKIPIPMNAVL